MNKKNKTHAIYDIKLKNEKSSGVTCDPGGTASNGGCGPQKGCERGKFPCIERCREHCNVLPLADQKSYWNSCRDCCIGCCD